MGNCQKTFQSLSPQSYSIMKSLVALLALIACASSLVLPQEKADNELLCSICVDLVTDLDNFITDDKTEQQIVEFVEQICHALGAISKDLEVQSPISTLLPPN